MPHGVRTQRMAGMNCDPRTLDLLSVITGIAIAIIDGEHFARGIVAAEEFSPGRRRNPGRNGQDQHQKTQ